MQLPTFCWGDWSFPIHTREHEDGGFFRTIRMATHKYDPSKSLVNGVENEAMSAVHGTDVLNPYPVRFWLLGGSWAEAIAGRLEAAPFMGF